MLHYMFINFLIILIFMLVSVAFFTIMERKLLGSFHIRLGPNKTGFQGIIQPFYDALKLFNKNINYINKINDLYWNFSPLVTFGFLILMMNFIPVKSENNKIILSMILLILIISLPIFSIFYSSLFSFSKFSIISCKRSITQMLSYEMGLMMIFILLIFINMNMNIMEIIISMSKMNFLSKLMMMLITFIVILSESSRIPFDFIEGESELVSGFNIEFSSSYFSLFFVYEYGMMLVFSIFNMMIFLDFIYFFILVFSFIWIRSSFPRLRYDKMMIFFWKMLYVFLISIMIYLKMF